MQIKGLIYYNRRLKLTKKNGRIIKDMELNTYGSVITMVGYQLYMMQKCLKLRILSKNK